MARHLEPRERRLLDLLEQAASNLAIAADLLDELLHYLPERNHLAREVGRHAQRSQAITSELHRRLAGTFVTPIPQEDIRSLASALAAVADQLELAADRIVLYRIDRLDHPARRIAQLLARAGRELDAGLPRIRVGESMLPLAGRLRELAREGRQHARVALAELVIGETEPLTAIAWKDVYEHLLAGIDAAVRLADTLTAMTSTTAGRPPWTAT